MATQGDGWHSDPDIMDDRCLVVHVRNQGLVVITDCCHSGIINTICHAKKISGIDKIHAIIGGFHLSGKFFKAVIPRMIQDLSAYQPDYLVPCHCTGWKAMQAMAQALPKASSPSCVSTKIHLQQAKEP
ncbi:MAG: MBL fold metallo-hydrolase [Magnetococcus sp. XQGC-1]